MKTVTQPRRQPWAWWGMAQAHPRVREVFKTGSGVPCEARGASTSKYISLINRTALVNLLASEWFPQVPGLVERLRADRPARAADVGSGTGWSSISIALGFRKTVMTGFVLDEASIDQAFAVSGIHPPRDILRRTL